MSGLELYFNNQRVDFMRPDDDSIRLSYANTSLEDLTDRDYSHSNTFDLPATKNNNAIFQQWQESNAVDADGVLMLKDFEVRKFGATVMRGLGRLEAVQIMSSAPQSWQLTIFAGEGNWAKQFENMLIKDLDFGTFTFTEGNVEDTFTDAAGTSPATADDHVSVWYPVHYGRWTGPPIGTAKIAIDIDDLRPHLFLKRIVDAMFTAVGYTLDSDFFDSAFFKKLTWVYAAPWIRDDAADFEFASSRVTLAQSLSGLSSAIVIFNTESSDPGNRYSTSTGKYIISGDAAEVRFTTSVILDNSAGGSPSVGTVKVIRNRGGESTLGLARTFGVDAGLTDTIDIDTKFVDVQDGDEIYVKIEKASGTFSSLVIAIGSTFDGEATGKIVETSTITLADHLPDKYTCLDVINDINTMFNLQWKTDPYLKRVIVEPEPNFAADMTNYVNWTDKLDTMEVEKTPHTDVAKINTFSYAVDDEDKWLAAFQGVGNFSTMYAVSHELNDRFRNDENTFEVSLFSPTAYVFDEATQAGVQIPDFPRLWQEASEDWNSPEKAYSFKPRILYYAGQTNANKSIYLFRQANVVVLPRAYVWDIESSTGDNSLAFGDIDSQPGLMRRYYLPRFEQFEEGYKLRAKFNLTPRDIAELDFQKLIYVNDAFYQLYRVNDYDPAAEETTEVELIRWYNQDRSITSTPGDGRTPVWDPDRFSPDIARGKFHGNPIRDNGSRTDEDTGIDYGKPTRDILGAGEKIGTFTNENIIEWVGSTARVPLTMELEIVSDTVVSETDRVNIFTPTSADITGQLPDPANISGETVWVTNDGSSGKDVIVAGPSGETIGGTATSYRVHDAHMVGFLSDGSNYHVVGADIVAGGNRKGATLSIGTRDTQDLTLKSNDVTRATFKSTGEWGFGITDPQNYGNTTKFVVGDSSGNAGVNIRAGSSSNAALLFSKTAALPGRNQGGLHYNMATDVMSVYVAGAIQHYYTASGFGVFQSSPTARFHVAQNSGANASFRLQPGTSDPTTLNDGDLYANSNRNNLINYHKNLMGLSGLLFSDSGSGGVSNTLVEGSLFSNLYGPNENATGGTATAERLNANFLTEGRTLRMTAMGRFTTTGTPGTLTLRFSIGATVISKTITPPASKTDAYFEMDLMIYCRSTGASGAIMVGGKIIMDTSVFPIVSTGTTAIDTTVNNTIAFTAQWSGLNQSITKQQFILVAQ